MKSRKIAFLLLVLVFVFMTTDALAQPTKLKSIGRYTFVRVRGKIPTPEVMKMLVDRYAADLKMGFDMAGYGDIYLPFLDQLKTATFTDTTLAVGDRVMWMLFRNQGKVKVTREIEWAGKAPLEVFGVDVKIGYKTYHFIIPKPCGNIALRNIDEAIPQASCSLTVMPEKANLNDPITVDMSGCQNAKSMVVEVFNAQGAKVASQTLTPESPKWQTKFEEPGEYAFKGVAFNVEGKPSADSCQAKAYINFPPVCKLWTSCLPCKDHVGRPIIFDLSGSTDPDGDITKGVFEIADASGKVIDTLTVTEKPMRWEKTILKAGTYSITSAVYDNAGAVSPASDACHIFFDVTQKKFFWMLEGGPLIARGTYTLYGFLRGGFFYWLAPSRFSLVVSGGGAIPSQSSPWKFMFLANALVNVHAGPAYFGAGLGFSTKEQNTRKSGLDIVGQVGVDVFNRWTSLGSVFFEFRSPLGSNRSFDEHHKFALGFRLLF